MSSVLLDAKLAPPPLGRPGSLIRDRLLGRVRAQDHGVVTVTAPAGYGKSTFLRQWAEHEDRAVAWVSLEPADDDDQTLLQYIAAALERASSVTRAPLEGVGQTGGTLRTAALTRLTAAMWQTARPTVLMLDDVDQLRTPAATDALSWLSEHLSPRTCLAVASRERPPLPVARLRARGQLLEIGVNDLAMSVTEAGEVLAQAGVRIGRARLAEMTRRAEGWPAGIYLTALSLRAGGAIGPGPGTDGGQDRYVADFVRSELLDRVAPELRAFLVTTAPLLRFDAELCDQVTGSRGSADLLAEVERTNLFLVPLDSRSQWYRYHHLFRELLLAELRRRQPDEEPVVLRRAAEWSAAHGDPEAAIEYAHLAGDEQLTARLLVDHALDVYRAGHLATLERWFGWFDAEQLTHAPELAILGAWMWALMGRTARAERWADVVTPPLERLDPVTRAWFAALRSVMGRMTEQELRDESHVAMDTMPAGDAWRAAAFLGGGVAELISGDVAAADVLLSRAIDIGLDTGGMPATIVALGARAHIATLREDWGYADELLGRARRLITEHGLEGYVTNTLAWAVGARVALQRGATEDASADLARVQRLRPVLTAALPWLSARVRLELAHAYLTLGEVAGARIMVAEVEELLAVRPGIASMAGEVAALRVRTASAGRARPGAATLTTAELRLLGYLPSHLSFREIAERLFVSINTVKTQAISIYGKLGVSSRSAAIEAAVATGLLDPSAARLPPSRPDIDLTRPG